MSQPDKEAHSERFEDELRPISQSFERYDLNGYKIKRWTTATRAKLVDMLRQVLALGKKFGETKLPGTSEKLSKKAKNLPGKSVEFIESQIEKTTIENQLKVSQTETEFLTQELLREQIKKTQAETEGQKLDNLSRMMEIQENIKELTADKTNIHMITEGEKEIVIFGNLPPVFDAGNDINKLYGQSISVLELSKSSKEYLMKVGITTIGQLINCRKTDLITINRIRKQIVEEIVKVLQVRGLSLRD